jgi:hypothetical protein
MRTKAIKRAAAAGDAAAASVVAGNPVNGNAAAVTDNAAKANEATRPPFWEFLHSLGDRWATEGIVVYCYRLWPVIDRRETEHYLAKLNEPFDEDFLLRTFGSGKYLLQANSGRGKTLHKRVVSLHNRDYPPKVALEEVVASDPRNQTYFETWVRKTNNGATEKSAKDVPADITALLSTVVSKSGTFDPQLAAMWERTAKERDQLSAALASQHAPPDLLALVKGIKELLPNPSPASTPQKSEALEIITALKAMQPPPAAPPDPLQLMAQAKELFGPAVGAEAPRNHIAELDQILGFAQKLASLRGGGGDRTGWDIGLDFAKEIGGPLLQTLNNFMQLRMGQPGGMPQPAAVSPAASAPTGAFDPYANQAALREHARRVNAQAAPAAPAPPQPISTASSLYGPQPPQQQPAPPPAQGGAPAVAPDGLPGVNEVLLLLSQYGGLVVNALNTNMGGHHFARSVAELTGVGTIAMITRHGEDVLTASMMGVPELAMFGEARLRKFSYEFTHYEEELADEEQEAEPEQESDRERVTA